MDAHTGDTVVPVLDDLTMDRVPMMDMTGYGAAGDREAPRAALTACGRSSTPANSTSRDCVTGRWKTTPCGSPETACPRVLLELKAITMTKNLYFPSHGVRAHPRSRVE